MNRPTFWDGATPTGNLLYDLANALEAFQEVTGERDAHLLIAADLTCRLLLGVREDGTLRVIPSRHLTPALMLAWLRDEVNSRQNTPVGPQEG